LPLPKLSPEEVLVQVKSAGINPLDVMMSKGYGKKLFESSGLPMRNLVLGTTLDKHAR
jgi:NADPH:quinone reductase-like Zn-dependent oxidoreductase